MANVCPKYTDDDLRRVLAEAVAAGKLSPQTERLYRGTMERILRTMRAAGSSSSKAATSICEVLRRPAESYRALEAASGSVQTLSTTLGVLLALMKWMGVREDATAGGEFTRVWRRWSALAAPLREEIRRQREGGEPTDRQRAGLVTWAQVVAKNESLVAAAEAAGTSDAAARAVAEALLSGFYVDLEPRRQADYHRLYVQRGHGARERARVDREPAHVDVSVDPPVLEVRRHKTAGSARLGVHRAEVPPRLAALLRTSLALDARDYVFQPLGGSDVAWTVGAFTKHRLRRLKAWFGPGTTNNSLRHARATAAAADPTLTTGERLQIARAMGHSIETHLGYAFVAPKPPATAVGAFSMTVKDPETGRPVAYTCSPDVAPAAPKDPKGEPKREPKRDPKKTGKQRPTIYKK